MESGRLDNKISFFIDKEDNLRVENRKKPGLLGRVVSKIKGRNYDILDVFNKINSEGKPILDESHIREIHKQVGHRLKLDPEVIRKIHDIIQNHEAGYVNPQLNELTNEMTNWENIKPLKKLLEHLDPKSKSCKVLRFMINEAEMKSKWKDLGLDSQLVDNHLDEARFLLASRLIYSIVGLQNTTRGGPINHAIKKTVVNADGQTSLMIKKEGEWVPVKTIMEEFAWDEEKVGWDEREAALASKNNPSERWNYFEDGLVPISRFYHHKEVYKDDYPMQNAQLQPVAQLSQEEVAELLDHAKAFEGFNTSENPKEELTCVLQFVTNPRPLFKKKWLQNLNGQVPVHCGIRLIQSDGKVFSTGFGVENSETFSSNKDVLATANGQPTILDYEEFRPHEGRIVTSIPIGEQGAEEILKTLNEYRVQTRRMNILKQNCMNLGTNVLKKAGVDLDIRVPLKDAVLRGLPGGKFKSLRSRVKEDYQSKVPEPAQKALKSLNNTLFFVPNTLGLLMSNLLIKGLGGAKATPLPVDQVDSGGILTPDESRSLKPFSRMLNGMMDKSASDIQHSSVFINWQLQQPTTVIHEYSGSPSMNILPNESQEAQDYSRKRRQEFWKMYRHGGPTNS